MLMPFALGGLPERPMLLLAEVDLRSDHGLMLV